MPQAHKSVVMYGSWLETARELLDNEDDVCRLMVQLMEYGLTGKVPENDNVIMKTIFKMAKPNIDSNIEKKINGKKGGRPRKNEKTIGLSNADANADANANADADANANDGGLTPPAASGSALEGAALAATGDGVVMDGREWYEEYLRNKRRG